VPEHLPEDGADASPAPQRPEFNLANPLKEMDAELQAMSEAHLTGSGETVIGPFNPDGGGPSYTQVADARGASYFSLGDEWSKFSPAQQLAANQHALDVAITNRDVITLSVPFDTIPKDTYTAAEIRYFEAHGYTLKGDYTLVPPPNGKS
jgi:hypothetical protein